MKVLEPCVASVFDYTGGMLKLVCVFVSTIYQLVNTHRCVEA